MQLGSIVELMWGARLADRVRGVIVKFEDPPEGLVIHVEAIDGPDPGKVYTVGNAHLWSVR